MDLPKSLDPTIRKCCATYQECYKNQTVEDLVENHTPDVILSVITPRELNANFKDATDLIRRKLRLLAYQFIQNHNLLAENTVVKVCTTPYINLQDRHLRSIQVKEEGCVQCSVLAAVSAMRRHWMIDSHYDKIYPHLELSKNRGVLNVEAGRILWQHGVPNEELFILENVYDLLPSVRLLDLQSSIVDGPLRAMTNHFDQTLTVKPDWWSTTFRELPYWDADANDQVNLLGRGQYPDRFNTWLDQESNQAHMNIYGSPAPYRSQNL
jgi:hypothetical protein